MVAFLLFNVYTGIPITSRFHVFSYLEVYLFQLFVPAISFQLSFDSVSFAHTLILTKQSPVHSATNVFTCFDMSFTRMLRYFELFNISPDLNKIDVKL